MRIVSLVAENFKRLVAVEIRPDGDLVEITGKNGAGKTSVLDALWAALAGAGVIQREPIRKGESSARIRLDLGEIVVTRVFERKDGGEFTTSVRVENADGARFPSPQKMLDSLLGALAFDPLAFARSAPREQFDTLKRFVSGVDFDAIEAANKADFEQRTAVNRRAKEFRAAAAAIVIDQDVSLVEVDESAILDEMQKASEHNQAIERKRAGIANQAAALDRDVARLAEMQSRVVRLRAELAQAEAEVATLSGTVDSARRVLDEASVAGAAPIDISGLRAQLDKARAANKLVSEQKQARASKATAEAEAERLEQQSATLSSQIEIRQVEKRRAIEAARMPIPGIGFGDGFVTLNGVPFEQASDAEQLRASVAIAMADNPKLRVIRVRDGSLLDSASLALLGEMAAQHDMQCWVEKVTDGEAMGFTIEDGRLKAMAVKESAAA